MSTHGMRLPLPWRSWRLVSRLVPRESTACTTAARISPPASQDAIPSCHHSRTAI